MNRNTLIVTSSAIFDAEGDEEHREESSHALAKP